MSDENLNISCDAQMFARANEVLRAEIDRLRADNERLKDVLRRAGFVECDIPACNCGSWHARYGYKMRFEEIQDAVDQAGINTNGSTLLQCVQAILAENEALRADKDRLDWIERNALSVDLVADPDGLVQVWYNTDPPKVSAAKWVRAAIDAAMKQEGER